MYIDSHCHLDRLDLTPYGDDFARYMAEARAQGLSRLLCVSISRAAFPAMAELVKPYPEIDLTFGVHPNEVEASEISVMDIVGQGAAPAIRAIGETGLDFFRTEQNAPWQLERFRRHIQAARQLGKPLVIHSRESRAMTLEILREEGADQVGGVMHCFSEDWETAKAALDLGFYISFSGILTFNSAHELRAVAEKLPMDSVLIETDAPYLAPAPYRGRSNYPHWVKRVVEVLAQLRGLRDETVADITRENYLRLFHGRK